MVNMKTNNFVIMRELRSSKDEKLSIACRVGWHTN